MKRLLAIDTSSTWCSIALSISKSGENQRVLHRHQQLGSAASQHLLPWVVELLDQADIALHDLDAIAVGVGPGAFTGVRLAVAATQGLAIASQLRLAPVPSLDAIAAIALDHPLIQSLPVGKYSFLVAIDARMGEVYWAKYGIAVAELNAATDKMRALPERLGDIELSTPEKINLNGIECAFGSAFSQYAPQFSNDLPAERLDASVGVSALGVLRCGETMLAKEELISAYDLEPLYVRNKVAQTIAERSAK